MPAALAAWKEAWEASALRDSGSVSMLCPPPSAFSPPPSVPRPLYSLLPTLYPLLSRLPILSCLDELFPGKPAAG
ncbi:MAG: hypothetical protein NZ602_03005, partial [Thermoguttaceae bacterium]|nr:hypothetical protein [Thermoguttaceae bacterium]